METFLAKRFFKLIQPTPISQAVRSRDCCNYLNRTMLYIGWIPPDRGPRRYIYLMWTCCVLALATIYSPIGFMLSLCMSLESFSLGELLGLLQISINVLGTSAKALSLLTQLSQLRQTQTVLDRLDERLHNDEDRWKIHVAVTRCNCTFLCYGILYSLYALSIGVAGALTGQLPWLIYNPLFDWRNGRLNFWLQSLLEYIIIGMTVAITLIEDAYSIVFILIFRAHADILKDHIRQLRTDPQQSEAKNYEDLVDCIVDHQLILECCQLMRPAITRTIFVHFLLIGIVLGMNLINLSHFQDIYHSASAIFYLLGILVESFPLCYQCDGLAEDCKDLSNLLAQSHWIDAEPRYKSTLRTFLYHLQQSIVFTAGGIFPITLNSNIRVSETIDIEIYIIFVSIHIFFQVAKFAFSVITVVERKNLLDRFQ
ncbi:hypothetical protein KR222_004505 [Zaprionus bogoriensis]|nr:hypothetical protein KR222_004505 [Zaprionus bogoriensis]